MCFLHQILRSLSKHTIKDTPSQNTWRSERGTPPVICNIKILLSYFRETQLCFAKFHFSRSNFTNKQTKITFISKSVNIVELDNALYMYNLKRKDTLN